MQATIVDLRYHMKDVLEALKRNEEVSILYHKKKIASLVPTRHTRKASVEDHAFFGMMRDEKTTINEIMQQLRGARYRDI